MSRRLLSGLVLVVSLAAVHACGKNADVTKRDFVKSGDQYAAQGKYAEAVIEYRNAVQQDPRFGEARRKLANTYRKLGDLPNAYQQAVRAADLLPDDPEAQFEAGELLLITNHFDDAKARADKALSLRPKYIQAQILRANALAGLHKLDDAVSEVENAIQNDPDQAISYASLGAIQMFRGDQKDAEAAFKKAVDADPNFVEARLALANFYWAVGRRADAEVQLKDVLKADPKHVLANRTLAILYMGSGRAAEAEAPLKVLAADSSSPDGKLALADYYVATHRVPEARAILDGIVSSGKDGFAKASLRLAGLGLVARDRAEATRLVDAVLAKEPGNADALVASAMLRSEDGHLDEALAAVKSAIKSAPQSARAEFVMGEIYLKRRDEADAIAAFTEALKLDPRMARAEVALARIHLAAGRLDEAEHFARSAIAKLSGYVDAHLILAQVNLMRGNATAAEPSIRALTRALPDLPAAQVQLGRLELLKGNEAAARQAFQHALAKAPDTLDATAGLITMDLRSGQRAAAHEKIDQAVQRAPNDGRTLLLASQVYGAVGDASAQERVLRHAVEVDDQNFDAYGGLGRLYWSQKRLDDAIAQFSTLTKKQPSSVAAHTFLGVLYELQKRTPEAQAEYERAIELDRTAPVAANNLAWLYLQTDGNLNQALQLAQTAQAKLSERPEVNDTLGWAYYKKGLYDQAIGPLSTAARLTPKNPSYLYHLGMAQAGNGDRTKARASLQQALAINQSFNGAEDARQALAKLN
jgi:tetratricopeptide (TPR) repeat protein